MESRQHCEELNHQIDVVRQRMELLQDNHPDQEGLFCPPRESNLKINNALATAAGDDRHDLTEQAPSRDDLGEVLKEAGTLCHQLNQPIQCVSGYTELIMMDLAKDDPIFDRLSAISTQVQRMANISRQLMEFIHSKRIVQNA